MSGPVRALAWKEARELAMGVAACVVLLILIHVAVPAEHAPFWAEMLVILIAPAAAAAFGAASIAGENAGGASEFLRARAVDVATILRVKLAAHAIATILVVLLAFALAQRSHLGGEGQWLRLIAAPPATTWMFGAVLVVTFFVVGVALSFVLPDELTAGPAAIVVGGMWCVLVLLPGIRLAGSDEVGLSGLWFMTPLLVLLPAIIAWRLARRDAWLASGPGSRTTRFVMLGLGVIAGAGASTALEEPFRARAVRAGRAIVEREPIVAMRGDGAVAFVATPEGGAPRAVVALVDRVRTLQVTVLPPGTRPIAWSDPDGTFLIAWPGGTVRAVTPAGDVRAAVDAAEGRALRDADQGGFWVEDGRLGYGRDKSGRGEIVFPRQKETKP